MNFLCLDFEGVLIPEIWQYVAKETNSEELMLTTQDLKNYDAIVLLAGLVGDPITKKYPEYLN